MCIKKVNQIIFDADDTLWENNIYYVNAAEELVRLLTETGENRTKIEKEFQELEKSVVKHMGYGSMNYIHILKTLFKRYFKSQIDSVDLSRLNKICIAFEQHVKIQPRIFPGVIETLSILKKHYRLYVLTKGNIEEQWGKLRRSDLLRFFNEAFVKPEKDLGTYLDIIQKNNWNPTRTCMIGNSPRSDINPALAAGLWAIYIPYEHTWVLDDEPLIENHPGLYTVSAFPEITSIFI
jgi:putative hydrolase of the HAD superfamily